MSPSKVSSEILGRETPMLIVHMGYYTRLDSLSSATVEFRRSFESNHGGWAPHDLCVGTRAAPITIGSPTYPPSSLYTDHRHRNIAYGS